MATKRGVLVASLVLLVLTVWMTFDGDAVFTGIVAEDRGWIVVVDPGHGGFDPGKVGVDGVLEKDINLEIARRVKELLEQNDVTVIMTREDDCGLEREGEGNKKSSDMRNRVALVNNSGADLAVSIHQNSFTDAASCGAQVFYHERSVEGKQLAEILQEQMKKTLQDGNHRLAKSNDSYYMLKKTECPFAIVECGFLSNPEETRLLQEEEYQEKVAWAVHLGILRYLNEELR